MIERLLTIVVLVVFVTPMHGQELEVSVDTLNLVQVDSDIETKLPVAVIKVSNIAPESANIKAIRVDVRQDSFRVSKEPRVLFQLTPCLDLLVVQATNIGWGPFEGKSFTLFPDDAMQGLRVRLKDLFGIEQPTKEAFARLESVGIAVFPIQGQDFAYYNAAPIEVPISRNLPGFGRTKPKKPQHSSAMTFDYANASSFQSDFKGAVTELNSAVTDRSNTVSAVRLLGKRPQLIRLADDELFWDRQLEAGLRGGATQQWYFVFGEHRALHVNKEVRGIATGVTVELADGVEPPPPIPVNVVLDKTIPGQPPKQHEFVLDFRTNKSATFEVKVELVYTVGNSAKEVSCWKPEQNYLTLTSAVPKLSYPTSLTGTRHLFDDTELKYFHNALLEHDPELLTRSLRVIHDELHCVSLRKELPFKRGGELRRLQDAISIVKSCGNTSQIDQAAQLLFHKVKLLREDLQSQSNTGKRTGLHSDGIALFPFICESYPEQAAYFAIFDAWSSVDGLNTDLLEQCLCINAVRQFLPSYRTEIEKYILDNKRILQSRPTTALALAILCNSKHRDVAMKLAVDAYQAYDTSVLATVVWANKLNPTEPLSWQLIKKILEAPSASADIAEVETVFAVAAYFGHVQLVELASKWVSKNCNEPSAGRAIECYFDLLERTKCKAPAELLELLSTNAFSHMVREKAKKLKQ